MSSRRRRHQVTWILAGTVLLVAADMLLWLGWLLWHALPVLLPAAAVVVASRRWKLHRQVSAWLTSRGPQARPLPVIQGQVISDLDRAELTRLRDQNAKLRTKVRVLGDMINGPEVRP